jgi:hypothetical protein
LGAFLFGGIEMAIHKCRRCVWSNKISSNLLYCIFPRCIIKEEIPEQAVGARESVVVPKARTTCDDKRKRGKKYVSKKTKKTL